jgi:biopolymer transport protein ExbB/TolQ
MSESPKVFRKREAPGRVERLWTLVVSGCLGAMFVLLLNVVGPWQIKSTAASGKEVVDIDLSRILVDWTYYKDDRGRVVNERNPLSVQAFMWVAMFIGLGELWIRGRAMRAERGLLVAKLLPEDERSLLTVEDLRPIYVRARSISRTGVLPVLVRRLSMEFRKSKSIDRVNALLDSSLELFQHRLDLKYTLMRYLVWVIPTLGFVGTVIGIANAMAFAGSGAVAMDEILAPTTQKLAVAFYTTLVALLQSGVLVLGMNSLQAGEELVLNDAGQYCLENLVMRLMEPGQLEEARGAGRSQ